MGADNRQFFPLARFPILETEMLVGMIRKFCIRLTFHTSVCSTYFINNLIQFELKVSKSVNNKIKPKF